MITAITAYRRAVRRYRRDGWSPKIARAIARVELVRAADEAELAWCEQSDLAAWSV